MSRIWLESATASGHARLHIGDQIYNLNGEDLRSLVKDLGRFLRTYSVEVFLRLSETVEFLLSLATIIVTGSAISGMVSILRWTGPPGKLVYNIILAAFTFIGLLISVCRWRLPNTHPRLWQYISLVINVVAAVAWIVASKCAWYECSDICSVATPKNRPQRFAGQCCDCAEPSGLQLFDCSLFETPGFGVPAEQRLHLYEVTQNLDITIAVFFGISSLIWFGLLYKGTKR